MKNRLLIFFITVLFLLLSARTKAQTIEGTGGLLFIPTAEVEKNNTLSIGVNYWDRNQVSFADYQYNGYSPYITFEFLSFIELNMRITRLVNFNGENEAIGDRTVSMRIRVMKEKETFPALLVGLHDVFTVFGGVDAIHNNALYLVASKNFETSLSYLKFSLHLGIGTDILPAVTHNFNGLFGGTSITLFSLAELIGEYDSKNFNTGIRIKLFDRIKLLGGFMSLKYFSGGLSFSFPLKSGITLN